MIKYLLNMFRKPLAENVATQSLAEYQRMLLLNEEQAAYHSKMADYYREGIERLHTFNKTYSITVSD